MDPRRVAGGWLRFDEDERSGNLLTDGGGIAIDERAQVVRSKSTAWPFTQAK